MSALIDQVFEREGSAGLNCVSVGPPWGSDFQVYAIQNAENCPSSEMVPFLREKFPAYKSHGWLGKGESGEVYWYLTNLPICTEATKLEDQVLWRIKAQKGSRGILYSGSRKALLEASGGMSSTTKYPHHVAFHRWLDIVGAHMTQVSDRVVVRVFLDPPLYISIVGEG